ncbi:MAG: hypothetical protein JSW08_00715 [archaeon]|nr:MAG: hypothetical protein JSW08_00715 [archaeon]
MASRKSHTKKTRLTKLKRRTKWTPFWVIPKAKGKGRRAHPSALTRVKRHWRRTKIKRRIKKTAKRRAGKEFISGRIRKKH